MVRWALVFVVACADPSIDGEVVHRGDHIELHAAPALPVCDASLASADRYLEAVGDYLGVAVPQVRYYFYDEPIVHCSAGDAAGCADHDNQVRAVNWIEHHELVHLAARPWGEAPLVFLEGL